MERAKTRGLWTEGQRTVGGLENIHSLEPQTLVTISTEISSTGPEATATTWGGHQTKCFGYPSEDIPSLTLKIQISSNYLRAPVRTE